MRLAGTGKLVTQIASLVDARQTCIERKNTEWIAKHTDRLKHFETLLPSGSGWDRGTTIDLVKSTPERLVLFGSFHHMNDGGYYDGWTDHEIVVTPSLQFGFTVKVTGRDRNDIKEYLTGLFLEALGQEVPER